MHVVLFWAVELGANNGKSSYIIVSIRTSKQKTLCSLPGIPLDPMHSPVLNTVRVTVRCPS